MASPPARTIVSCALAAAASVGAFAEPQLVDTGDPIADLGIIVHTSVERTLLDIEVRDVAGRPMRGLSAADFELRLNGRIQPLASVDDLCDCPDPADVAAAASAPPFYFVLHLDFGRMLPDDNYTSPWATATLPHL